MPPYKQHTQALHLLGVTCEMNSKRTLCHAGCAYKRGSYSWRWQVIKKMAQQSFAQDNPLRLTLEPQALVTSTDSFMATNNMRHKNKACDTLTFAQWMLRQLSLLKGHHCIWWWNLLRCLQPWGIRGLQRVILGNICNNRWLAQEWIYPTSHLWPCML